MTAREGACATRHGLNQRLLSLLTILSPLLPPESRNPSGSSERAIFFVCPAAARRIVEARSKARQQRRSWERSGDAVEARRVAGGRGVEVGGDTAMASVPKVSGRTRRGFMGGGE